MSRPNLADLMIERMRDGRAHDDSLLMLTACVEQIRSRTEGEPWEHDLFLAQAEVLCGGEDFGESLARCAAMALDLGSLAATILISLADGLGYDVDAVLAGMAQVRPPYAP